MTVHSHLGASGAHRWMECPGSVTLSNTLGVPQDEEQIEPEYRTQGTAAHSLATVCLQTGKDTWMLANEYFDGVKASVLDLEAVQLYVDECRRHVGECDEILIEKTIGDNPIERPHDAFFGTVDFASISPLRIVIRDFKYGVGVEVSPVRNPQIMYYAFGVIESIRHSGVGLSLELEIDLGIVQPRVSEDVKTWKTTVGDILDWAREDLIPAMKRADEDQTLVAGEHCRFCPAKLACPLLKGMFKVAATINSDWLKEASDATLGHEYEQIATVKKYIKALEDEAYTRVVLNGKKVDGLKVVDKKASRVWKDDARDQVIARLGEDFALEPAALKSPAVIEKTGPEGKALVAELAFTPHTGYTVATVADKRPEVKVVTPAETFAHFMSAGIEE